MAPSEARPHLSGLSWTRAVVVVVVCAVAVFGNAMLCGWSGWDDPLYVLGNDRILDTSVGSLVGLWSFEHAHLGGFIEYFPLRDTVYWMIHRLFGLNPLPYHVTNIGFHALTSALVVVLGRRLRFSSAAAMVAGIIFAVHPAHCESVVWISALKDPMFTSFLLLSIIFYEPSDTGRRHYLVSFLFFMLSLLCKSIGFMLPALLLVLEWRRGNVKPGAVLAIVPFGLIALLFLANFMLIGRSNDVIVEHWGGGPVTIVMTSLWCFVMYVSLELLPINLYLLHIIPPIMSTTDLRGISATVICSGLLVGVLAVMVRSRTAGLLVLWYIIFLLPVLNIVPIPVLVAERYLYLPSVAFCLGLGLGLTHLATRSRALAVAVTALIVVGLAARTVARNEDWRGGDVVLWQGVVTQPTAAVFDGAWVQLGEALLRENRVVEAELALLRAIEIQDQNNVQPTRRSLAHGYLGIEYLEAGRYDLAKHHLKRSLTFNRRLPDVWNSLSSAESATGNRVGAEHAANMAVQLDPGFGSARYNRGLARIDLGRVDEGVADVASAVAADAALCRKLGLFLNAVGDTPVGAAVHAATAGSCSEAAP